MKRTKWLIIRIIWSSGAIIVGALLGALLYKGSSYLADHAYGENTHPIATATMVPDPTFSPDSVPIDHTAVYLNTSTRQDNLPEIQADDTSNWSFPTKEKRKRSADYIKLSDSEITILASLVFFEGGAESIESQRAIASVVINRMKLDDLSLRQVVFAKNQFEPAHLIGHKSISSKYMKKSTKIVKYVCKHGPTIPKYVTYFRADYYHSWSGMHAYKKIDKTYFSYDQACYDRYIKQKKS
jgi:hypothetical protein